MDWQIKVVFYLSIIKVAETSNDLLLVQLIGFELHASHGLHGAVVLKPLLSRKHSLLGWTILQLVQVTFLINNRRF